jgi:hypothetical protein
VETINDIIDSGRNRNHWDTAPGGIGGQGQTLEKSGPTCQHQAMTRSEAIAIITLPALDEAQAATLAELAQTLVQSPVALSLTDEDRDGIARAREDFKAGRTHSSREARAMTADFFAKLRGT